MAEGSLVIYRAVPGAATTLPILKRFGQEEGVVTSFGDQLLPALRRLAPSDADIEILPFGSLVTRTLVEAGEPARRLPSTGIMLAAVTQAVREQGDESPFATVTRFPGLAKRLADALHELEEWNLRPEKLEAISTSVSPALAFKLTSLAGVVRRTEATLAQIGFQSTTDQIRTCVESLVETDGASKRLLVFLGGEAHPAKYAWLRWATTQGHEVWAVAERHATNGPLFREAQPWIGQLGSGVRDIGEGNVLLNEMFTATPHGGVNLPTAVMSAADPLAEVEWTLRKCQLELEHGSVGICARSLQRYAPLLEAASRRLGVSIDMARRAPLLTNAFVRLTLCVLEACVGNDVRSLSEVLSSSYLQLEQGVQARLRDGIRAAHLRREQQWNELGAWVETLDEPYQWLAKVVQWRQQEIGRSQTLAEWLSSLHDLVHELPWHGSLGEAQGYDAERDARALAVMRNALTSVASVEALSQGGAFSLPEFVCRCRSTWEGSDVSVPSRAGKVLVAADSYGMLGMDSVHILGVLEGAMPRRRTEDAILSDVERSEINAAIGDGDPLLLSSDVAARERDEFYRVCAAPKERLSLSYPTTDGDRETIPALFLKTVERIVRTEREHHPRSDLAARAGEVQTEADRALGEALHGVREFPQPVELLSEEARIAACKEAGAAFTVAELKHAQRCPFLRLSSDHLQLRPRRWQERWSSLVAVPRAAHLAASPTPEAATAVLNAAMDAHLDELQDVTPSWEIRLLRAGAKRLIIGWVQREFLARAIWKRSVDGVETGPRFGENLLRDAMTSGVVLSGTVDAVARQGATDIAQIYARYCPDSRDGVFPEEEMVGFGALFLALFQRGRSAALEIDGMNGKRSFVVIRRADWPGLSSRGNELKVCDLSQTIDDGSLRRFFDETKALLARTAASAFEGDVTVRTGDHCRSCSVGELCRRAPEFGEEEPYAPDVARSAST